VRATSPLFVAFVDAPLRYRAYLSRGFISLHPWLPTFCTYGARELENLSQAKQAESLQAKYGMATGRQIPPIVGMTLTTDARPGVVVAACRRRAVG